MVMNIVRFAVVVFMFGHVVFGQSINIPFTFPQYFDNNGNPLNGGKIYAYAAGTTTLINTYPTAALTAPANANPIVLNSAGRPAVPIYLQNVAYKFVLTTSTGVILQTSDFVYSSALIGGGWTFDGISTVATMNTSTVNVGVGGSMDIGISTDTLGTGSITASHVKRLLVRYATDDTTQFNVAGYVDSNQIAATANSVQGFDVTVRASHNAGTVNLIEGIAGTANVIGTGTTTQARAIQANTGIYGTGGGTDMVAFRAEPGGRISGGTGTYTNGYGLYVNTFGAGYTNKWGLYVNDATARNYLPGVLLIGGATTTDLIPTPALAALDPGTGIVTMTGTSGASYVGLAISAVNGAFLTSGRTSGAGTYLPLKFNVGGGVKGVWQTDGTLTVGGLTSTDLASYGIVSANGVPIAVASGTVDASYIAMSVTGGSAANLISGRSTVSGTYLPLQILTGGSVQGTWTTGGTLLIGQASSDLGASPALLASNARAIGVVTGTVDASVISININSGTGAAFLTSGRTSGSGSYLPLKISVGGSTVSQFATSGTDRTCLWINGSLRLLSITAGNVVDGGACP